MPYTDATTHAAMDRFVAAAGTDDSPTVLYMALSTTTPGSDGSNVTEPSGGSYARVQVTSGLWAASASREKALTNSIEFAEATGSWGTVTHLVLFDHATNTASSNVRAWGALTTSKAVVSGEIFRAPAGSFKLSMPAA